MPAPGHYSYVTRTLIGLFEEEKLANVVSMDVEPEYGYATRIHYRDGSVRMTLGNDVGLNPSGASAIAKDKGHTKHFLTLSGISCPIGSTFLLPWWAEQLRPRLRTHNVVSVRLPEHVKPYIDESLAYPVYVKAVDGSQGGQVYRCDSDRAVAEAMEALDRDHVRVAIVEETINMPDFRLVVLDNEVISAYLRTPLTVAGDGKSTVAELLAAKAQHFESIGRVFGVSIDDARLGSCLREQDLGPDSVPDQGAVVPLLRLSNLSLGGSARDVTEMLAPGWSELAVRIARLLGLRYCGVDLGCNDISSPDPSEFSVLEVNSSPGLDHYAEVGPAQDATVRALYAKVLDALPGSPGSVAGSPVRI